MVYNYVKEEQIGNRFTNTLKGEVVATGSDILIDDVSPIAHDIKLSVTNGDGNLEMVRVSNGDETNEEFIDIVNDGKFYNIPYRYPSIRIIGSSDNATMRCVYNRDTNKVIEKLTNAIISLGGNV